MKDGSREQLGGTPRPRLPIENPICPSCGYPLSPPKSEARLKLVLEATSEGVWERNFGQRPDYFSNVMYTMLGHQPIDPASGFEFFRSLLHPDDVQSFETLWRELDKPGSDEYASRFRLRASNGSWRHILSKARCIERDAEGRATRVLGTHTDITEQVHLEEAYHLWVEHALQGLAIVQGGRVVFANPAFAELIGHTVTEVSNLSSEEVKLLVHAEDRDGVWEVGSDVLTGDDDSARLEFRLIRSDGAMRWVDTLLSRITYREEPALQVSYVDITDRKKAEESLRQSLEETKRSRNLVAALSLAAQAVQRARTVEEVYQAIGEQVCALGYQATIFRLSEQGTHLVVTHLTLAPEQLRAAEELTGLSAQDYRFPIEPDGLFQRIIEQGEAAFTTNESRHLGEALPRGLRPLSKQLIRVLAMEHSIVAPLTIANKVQGLLGVSGSGLTKDDIPTVTAFANQAAIALENAELLVTVTQQRRELHNLSVRLLKVQEEERGRISRELHDETGQALTAMSINLAEIEKGLPPDVDPVTQQRVTETQALLEQTLEQIGALALELRPSMLDELGLVSALRWYINRYAQRSGISVQVEAVDLEERLNPEVETALYRIVQEALTNVARHANATCVRVGLRRKAYTLVTTISDNGRGFDTEEFASRAALGHGAGLLGIRERVALLGGSFSIKSTVGGGTELFVRLPLHGKEET